MSGTLMWKKKNKAVLNQSIRRVSTAASLSVLAMLFAQQVLAVPDQGDFVDNMSGPVSSDAGVSYVEMDSALNFSQDNQQAVFGGTNGFDIDASTTLTVNGSAGWNALIRDISGTRSDILGGLNANGMNIYLVNPAGVLFGANASLNLGSLLASTLDISTDNFRNQNYQFVSAGGNGVITIDGLTVNNNGSGQLNATLLANQIDVNGTVNVDGNLNLLTADSVTVSYNGGLVEFEMVQELTNSAGGLAAINIGANGEIIADNVKMQAHVGSAYDFALFNQGIVRAVGIGASEDGTIRLLGEDSVVLSSGELDVSGANQNGHIDIEAAEVYLAGKVDGDNNVSGSSNSTMQVTIDSSSGPGRLEILDSAEFELGTLTVNGVGLGNTLDGLKEYRVTGFDTGTAGYEGIGNVNWNNFSNLVASARDDNAVNVFEITAGSNLSGTLTGTEKSDYFLIEGFANTLKGEGDQDTFEFFPNGGVNTIDGGADFDSILNVTNATIGGLSGSSSEVLVGWTNIQHVTVLAPPLPPIPPFPVTPVTAAPAGVVPGLLVPTPAAFNINSVSSASLGLIGDGNNLRLPCAHMNRDPLMTGEEALAAAEGCTDPFATPEYQELMASIIYFDTDKFSLTPSSENRLMRVLDFIVDSQQISKLMIAGHTDDVGSVAYNDALSQRRANSVAEFFRSRGVSDSLFQLHYFGESLPIYPNDSAENRSLNRRVEVTLER